MPKPKTNSDLIPFNKHSRTWASGCGTVGIEGCIWHQRTPGLNPAISNIYKRPFIFCYLLKILKMAHKKRGTMQHKLTEKY